MGAILSSLIFAVSHVLHPRMLWLMLWPLLAALFLWGSVALFFWAQLVLWLAGILRDWIAYATFFVAWDAGDFARLAAKLMLFLALVPLIQLTMLLLIGVFGMQGMVGFVADRRYPALERRHGGSAAGAAWNSAIAVAGMCVLGALSLPLWIFPPLWPAIPVAIMGWVNQRVLRYDALAEHADAHEARELFSRQRGALFLLGVLLAFAAFVPMLGFFAPVLFGLAFVHFLLGELKALRRAPGAVSASSP